MAVCFDRTPDYCVEKPRTVIRAIWNKVLPVSLVGWAEARSPTSANAHVSLGFTFVQPNLPALTLIAFEVKTDHPDVTARFVLNLPATGIPEERNAAILQTVIRNQDGFIRYLLLLLGDDSVSGPDRGNGSAGNSYTYCVMCSAIIIIRN